MLILFGVVGFLFANLFVHIQPKSMIFLFYQQCKKHDLHPRKKNRHHTNKPSLSLPLSVSSYSQMVQQEEEEEFRDAHDSFDDPISKASFPPSSAGLRRRRPSNAAPVRRKPHKFSSNLKDVNNYPKLNHHTNGNYLNSSVITTDNDFDDQSVTESSVTVDSGPNSNIAPLLLLLLKASVYQANLLIGFVTFPIWVAYYSYLLLLVITRRVRRYTIRKISRFLSFCLGNVKRVVYEWIKRNSNSVLKLCQRVGWGLLRSVFIGFILVGLLIFAFVISGALVKCVLDEPMERFEELTFDYTRDAPVAFMPIMSCPQSFCDECDKDFEFGNHAQSGRVIPLGHKLLATVSLTLPESDYNRNLGIFQLCAGTPPGTVQLLTPSTQLTPQSSEHVDQSQSDAMKYKGNESEPEEVANISEDGMKMDPLDKFLPPPPNTKCSDELQEKIIKFLLLKKKTGRSYNSEVRNRKEYRNPDFLLHAVTYQDIDQIGSCFSKDVFDPHGYDKSDYYDEIEADLKRELERKEQEKKKNQKIDFLSGGTQPAVSIPTSKMVPIPPVASIAGGGSNSVSAAVDTGTREGRPNKKSKWDKVDGNRRHPLTTSGQDSLSSVGSNATLLSSSNAGSGYTAFAQQRRREAEERKSSDRKLDRRS